MLTESLEERSKWFDKNKCQFSDKQLFIHEDKSDDKKKNACIRVTCHVSAKAFYVKGEEARVACLKNQQAADAIIFVSDEKTDLHIIECKTQVTSGNSNSGWTHIKQQFEGALLIALAIHAVLNLAEIKTVNVYTVFHNDKLTDKLNSEKNTNLSLVEIPKNVQEAQDWINDEITILSLKKVKHHKIQLDEYFHATINL